MGWLILFFTLYFLVLLAEYALVNLSTHESDVLRADDSPSARRAFIPAAQLRPALSALLLARLLLFSLIISLGIGGAMQRAAVHTALYRAATAVGLSPQIVWFFSAALAASAFALVFWAMGRFAPEKLVKGRAAQWLRYLSPFIIFWRRLFKLFIPKDNHSNALASETTAGSAQTAEEAPAGGEQREMEMLKSIVKFSDVTVRQVMQPRSKVVAVDFRMHFHEVLQVARDSGFSRLPVYDEDLDNVTGILYVKDLVAHLDKDNDFEWQALIRTHVMLAPETKRVSELLQEFKKNKRHMAIVVDEYGGSAGIVTMEDILEEVTGEIRDEFDEESDIRYRKLDLYNYLFEGQTLLNDVCRIAGLSPGAFDAVRADADTLAGLALQLNGDIPAAGAELQWENYLLVITAADKRRIKQIKLTLRS